MTNRVLDINCDMGESFGNWKAGNDAAVMPKITTANIACGFHAGDPVTMMRTVELAMANKVAIGAHPGLPDLLGFGRRIMAVSPEEIYAYVAYQCQSAFKFDPRSASNFDPFWRRVLAVALAPSELVGVAETARARVVG